MIYIRSIYIRSIYIRSIAFGLALAAGAQAAQYVSSNVTGQLTRTAVVNLLQLSQAQEQQLQATGNVGPELPHAIPLLHPPVTQRLSAQEVVPFPPSLVVSAASVFGFNGITHADQRLSNGGNQFSIEPPSQGLAVANGFILEGVNNAVRVFSTAGAPLTNTVSTNQLFNLAPAINRTTGAIGPFPTDIRVFYDAGINRWFVLQRVQDNDVFGNLQNLSHLYIAVSQTGDPTAAYNVYAMDTTNTAAFGCPCLSDFPQIGADQYGVYISANDYNTSFQNFTHASILAISKPSLGTGAISPPTFRFIIPFTTGYEFTIQPANTPPGASNLVSSGGVEYFLSTQAGFSSNGGVGLWAMSNTASMATQTPNLLLTQIEVPSLNYTFPDVARQRPGPLPYGSSLTPPGVLELLDGNDTRMLSVTYAGGRLYATWASQVLDGSGHSVVGGVYMILSPAYRGGVLTGSALRQGYLSINGNHLLRPSIAVNAQGRGAVVFTIVGPDYFPSAAFVTIDTTSTGTTAQLAAAGAFPEDGFTGYPDFGGQGVARWGDYAAATVAADGTVWMATEYIPNLPRTQFANWGTFVMRYIP